MFTPKTSLLSDRNPLSIVRHVSHSSFCLLYCESLGVFFFFFLLLVIHVNSHKLHVQIAPLINSLEKRLKSETGNIYNKLQLHYCNRKQETHGALLLSCL